MPVGRTEAVHGADDADLAALHAPGRSHGDGAFTPDSIRPPRRFRFCSAPILAAEKPRRQSAPRASVRERLPNPTMRASSSRRQTPPVAPVAVCRNTSAKTPASATPAKTRQRSAAVRLPSSRRCSPPGATRRSPRGSSAGTESYGTSTACTRRSARSLAVGRDLDRAHGHVCGDPPPDLRGDTVGNFRRLQPRRRLIGARLPQRARPRIECIESADGERFLFESTWHSR